MTPAVWMFINVAGAALIVFAIMFALSRRYVPTFVALALGTGLIAVNYLVVLPALTDPEKERLRADFAELRRDESRIRGELAESTREMGRVEASYRQSQAAIEAQAKAHTAQLDRIGLELAEARSHLTSEAFGLVPPAPGAPMPSAHNGDDRVLAAARELRALRPRAAPPSPRVEDRQDQVRDLLQLKERMTARLSTPSYDVEVYPDRELVGGRRGRYYVVDLKDASSGVRYFFEGGRYTINRGASEFRGSLNAFISDVLSKIEGNARYDLFVRGSADSKPYQGRLEPGYEVRHVRYLRSAGQDKYRMEFGERAIDSVVRNDDLPDLRASFISHIVGESYPVKRPIVLEGAVTAKHDTKDRNVELILYIDW